MSPKTGESNDAVCVILLIQLAGVNFLTQRDAYLHLQGPQEG